MTSWRERSFFLAQCRLLPDPQLKSWPIDRGVPSAAEDMLLESSGREVEEAKAVEAM